MAEVKNLKETACAEKMVKVKLPKAREGEEPEVFVGVNGKAWRIRKGVEVELPEYVAEVLRNSERADDHLDEFLEANKGKSAPDQ